MLEGMKYFFSESPWTKFSYRIFGATSKSLYDDIQVMNSSAPPGRFPFKMLPRLGLNLVMKVSI